MSGADNARALVRLPPAVDLAAWSECLAEEYREVIGEASAPTAEAAVRRGVVLTSMRMWLLGAMQIQLSTTHGLPVSSDDPDQMPLARWWRNRG